MTDQTNNADVAPIQYTYAVGDIHGRLDLLQSALEAINDHVADQRFRLVFLGDYVDRGPKSRQVIELLMAAQQKWPVVCLKGNHEDLMLRALITPGEGNMRRWLDNGGVETLQSYGVEPGPEAIDAIPSAHVRWLASLPLTTGDSHRIYVHAGLMPRTAAHRQNEQTCLWIRDRFLTAKPGDFEAHVVHGHTPLWLGKTEAGKPELLEHRTNLDTGAFATGILTVGVFDAAVPGGPVELLSISGPTAHHPAITLEEEGANEGTEPPAPRERREKRRGWGRLFSG